MTCRTKLTHSPTGTTHEWESPSGMTGGTVELQQNDIELTAFIDADDPDTRFWSVFTPEATLRMTVMNPEAARYFEPGQDYRVTITKVQPSKARD